MQETPQRMLDGSTTDQGGDKQAGRVFLLGDAAGGIFPALGQ